MIYTTLNRIRAHSTSADAWRKLLTHLGKAEADDDPLAYSVILEAVGLEYTLWCLQAEPQHTNIWRMYAVRAARSVQHLMKDERSLRALDVAERHARGEAKDAELAAARDAARDAAWDATRPAAWAAAMGAAWGAAGAAAWAAAWDAAWASVWAATASVRDAGASTWDAACDAARERMAADFRALLASHEALPGESCALNEWGLTEVAALAQQPAAGEVDDDGRDAPAQATQAVPQGWPRAAKGQRDQGWTLEYRFLERVTDLAASRTEYSTSMEATEQVLIAALEVLAAQQQGGAA